MRRSTRGKTLSVSRTKSRSTHNTIIVHDIGSPILPHSSNSAPIPLLAVLELGVDHVAHGKCCGIVPLLAFLDGTF